MNRLSILICAAAAATLMASCAKDTTTLPNDGNKRFLEAWMKIHHPDAVKGDLGIYILEERTGSGREAGSAQDYPYAYVSYTATDLDGNILESTDASYGLCLKFTDAAENVVPRWSKVLVSLDGLTLERESNPIRYTLHGLTADKITVAEDGTAVPEKSRAIAQLSDADIFTYVSLQSVEIMCKDGSYTNAS